MATNYPFQWNLIFFSIYKRRKHAKQYYDLTLIKMNLVERAAWEKKILN